jgi:hypothetical protein
MKLIKNKKGSDKVLSIYWFVILFIVSTGIFGMVYVYYHAPFNVRGAEGDIMANKIVECISQQGKTSSAWISGANTNTQASNTCQNARDCQKIIGTKIASIISGIKNTLPADVDSSVKQEDVAENLNCLVLQIAMQESSLQHCKQPQVNGNPLYCDGNRTDVKALDNARETSLGVLQVNTNVHSVAAEYFDLSVAYAVKNVLITNYNQYNAGNLFASTNTVYSGWKAAIRGYNGWGSGGDNQYVEHVIGQKDYVNQLFPELCSPGATTIVGQKKDIASECHLNFNSEFKEQQQYYVQVDFYDLKTFQVTTTANGEKITSQPVATVFDGNENLKADCELQKDKNFKIQSKCVEKRFYSVDEKNNPYIINVLSVIRKTEKNAVQ